MSNRAFRNDLRALIPREKPQSRLAPAPIRPRIAASEGRSGEILPPIASGGGGQGLNFPITPITREVYLQDVLDSAGHTIQQKVIISIRYNDADGTPFDWPTGHTLPTGATLVTEPAI